MPSPLRGPGLPVKRMLDGRFARIILAIHVSVSAYDRVYPDMDKYQLQDMLTSLPQLPGIMLSGARAHSLESMKKCRTPEMGGRVLICPECGTKIVEYNPCNIRGCPLCYQKNQLQWQTKAKRRILPTRHYHLTFTIPGYYTQIWLRHPNEIIESLFQSVRVAIAKLGESEEVLLGSLLAFQSHGIGMSYKPHMHCVLSGGGLNSIGVYREIRSIPLRMLETIFKEEFENNIKNSIGLEEELRIGKDNKNNYRVYTGIHEESGNNIIEYLAASRNGVVLDIEKDIDIDSDGIVVIKENDNGKVRIIHLDIKTFLDRYLNHIPPERTVMARYYGLYSNRHKDDYKKARKQIKNVNKEEDIKPYKELCPVCNAETRVAYLFNRNEIMLIPDIKYPNGPPRHGEIIKTA